MASAPVLMVVGEDSSKGSAQFNEHDSALVRQCFDYDIAKFEVSLKNLPKWRNFGNSGHTGKGAKIEIKGLDSFDANIS